MKTPWLDHYDPGIPASIGTYPSKTLADIVAERARATPRATALVFKGRTVSYRDLHGASLSMAMTLVRLGVRAGDRVALLLPNCPQFLIAELAAWRIGAIVAPLNPIYNERELQAAFRTSEPRVIVTLSAFYEKVKRSQPGTTLERVIVANIKEYLPTVLRILFTVAKERQEGHRVEPRDGDVRFQDALRAPRLAAGSVARPEDAAVILMSGGTTGTPKGVVTDHSALVMAGTQLATWLREPLAEKKAGTLLPLPLYHTYGCSGAQSMAIISGTRLILVPDARDLRDLLQTITRDKPVLAAVVPTLLSGMLRHPDVVSGKASLRSLKACFSGAASLMAETKAQFEQVTGSRVLEGYSLTEASMACCTNPYRGVTKVGSVGMPLPDVRVKIVDADDGKREMPLGEVGEITISAPQLMRGYWNNAIETANALRLDDDGTWLFTGDLGYLDRDGYLFLVDRKKDLIKTSGYQVWPREVEEVIASYPGVAEVGVAGLPDSKKGEIVAAWVVPAPGSSVDSAALREYCRDRMAPYKVPGRIEVRTSLPKTMIGKILRRELVAEAKAAMAAGRGAPAVAVS